MEPDWLRDRREAAERANWPLWRRLLSVLSHKVMWPLISIALFALAVTVGQIGVSIVRAVFGISSIGPIALGVGRPDLGGLVSSDPA